MPDASEQRLFFLLQRAAHRLRLDADRRCLAEAGITSAQLGALFAIRDQPECTQRELAAVLDQRESGITAMINRLDTAGLVARAAHPHEHRALVLTLTDAGHRALNAVAGEVESFNRALRELLGERDFARTTAALRKLADWA